MTDNDRDEHEFCERAMLDAQSEIARLKAENAQLRFIVEQIVWKNDHGTAPVELTLLATIRGGRVTEAYIHEKFSRLRRRGEWFSARKSLVDFIGSMLDADEDDGDTVD